MGMLSKWSVVFSKQKILLLGLTTEQPSLIFSPMLKNKDKQFYNHDTITVVVGHYCIAKVLRNYNCYNVYFNEYLRLQALQGIVNGFKWTLGQLIILQLFTSKPKLRNKQNNALNTNYHVQKSNKHQYLLFHMVC